MALDSRASECGALKFAVYFTKAQSSQNEALQMSKYVSHLMDACCSHQPQLPWALSNGM